MNKNMWLGEEKLITRKLSNQEACYLYFLPTRSDAAANVINEKQFRHNLMQHTNHFYFVQAEMKKICPEPI